MPLKFNPLGPFGFDYYETGSAATGDMTKAVYDPDNDGKVISAVTADNATRFGGELPAYYVTAADFATEQATRAAADTALDTRVTTLENHELKVTYFVQINSNTGTIVIPTGATILADQFPGGVDAYVSTLDTGEPTGDYPQTAGGVDVDVASFDTLGNYTLTGVPSIYPVALIFVLKIKLKDIGNLTMSNIVEYQYEDGVVHLTRNETIDGLKVFLKMVELSGLGSNGKLYFSGATGGIIEAINYITLKGGNAVADIFGDAAGNLRLAGNPNGTAGLGIVQKAYNGSSWVDVIRLLNVASGNPVFNVDQILVHAKASDEAIYNHGTVSGTVTLDLEKSVHDMSINGDTTLDYSNAPASSDTARSIRIYIRNTSGTSYTVSFTASKFGLDGIATITVESDATKKLILSGDYNTIGSKLNLVPVFLTNN